MIRPADSYATGAEIAALMRPLYETKPQFDQALPCIQCDGHAIYREQVCRLCRGTGWRLRGTEPQAPERKKNAPHNPRVKFSAEVVATIRRHSNQPMAHVAKIAAKYGMSYSQARRIIKGEGRR